MNELEILLSEEFKQLVEENLNRDPHRIALDKKLPHAALVASQVKYLKRAERKLPSYFAARCVLPPMAFEQASSEATAARKSGATVQIENAIAARKSQDTAPQNRLCIDLTCGLGVDSLALSRKFKRVIAIERDPFLAAVARENFRRLATYNLGAHNIEVVCADSADYLSDFEGDADLIYADPDRRGRDGKNEGKKLVRLEDCSPDLPAMLPLLGRIAPRLVVKLSPLFDVDEVFRVFGAGATHNPNHTGEQGVSGLSGDKKGADDMSSDTHTHVTTPSVVSVDVVSLAGECKEIVAEISFTDHVATPTIRAVMVGVGEIEFPFGDGWTAPPQEFTPEHYKWLVVPDVALQKSRLARRYFSERGISKQEDSREPAGSAGGLCDIYIDSDNGYGFAEVGTDAKTGTIAANTTSSANAEMEQSPLTKFNGLLSESGNKRLQERDALPNRTELPESIGLPGRIFEIESIEPFDPKALKRHLKAAGIKNIDIMRRNFPLSTANIAHQIGVREGGEKKLAFTKAAERLWQVTLK